MECYQEEIIKAVMVNYITNMASNKTMPSYNGNYGLLDHKYIEDLNLNKPSLGNDYLNQFSFDDKLKINASVEFFLEIHPNALLIIDFLRAKTQSLLGNARATIDLCSTYLDHFPLCCEVLLVKSQNELKINSIREALLSIESWNKSQLSIYDQTKVKDDLPILIHRKHNKFNIYKYRNIFYIEPVNKNYYGIRLILGDIFLIPNNYLTRKIRSFKKIFSLIFKSVPFLSLFLKIRSKNMGANGTNYQDNLLSFLMRTITKPLKSPILIICKKCLGLARPKSFPSFQEAVDAATISS